MIRHVDVIRMADGSLLLSARKHPMTLYNAIASREDWYLCGVF